MGWLIILTIVLAAIGTYLVYIVLAFKRANFTRSYPVINVTRNKGGLNNICT